MLVALAMVVAAMGVARAGAHGTTCAGHESLVYNQTFFTATFEFDLDRCTGSGNMDLTLSVTRDADAPETATMRCAPDTVCFARVQIRHLPVERARYVVRWTYDTDGTVQVRGDERRVLDCTSVVVRHGCPLELTP